ncbi:MAG: AI-2E family transporter [Candidatus Sumerlaeia bacterium]|nr:AI-2E family transporter [Candidatus Sumerlaeia bacterium]
MENPAPQQPTTYVALDPKLRGVALTIGYMLIAAGSVLALIALWPLLRFAINLVLPFLVAVVIAYILNPVVTFLAVRLRLQRTGALLVFYLISALAVGTFLGLVVPILYKQTQAAVTGITETLPARANEFLESRGIPPDEVWPRLNELLVRHGVDYKALLERAAQSGDVQQAAQKAASGGVEFLGMVLGGLWTAISGTIASATFLVFVVLISFYLIVDFGKFRSTMEVMIPERHAARTFHVLEKCDGAVGGFLRGQLISAVLVGLLVMAGLTALGMGRYAVLIGVVAIVGNLIPYLGPVLAGAPAVLYMLLSDDHQTLNDKLAWSGAALGLFIVIQQIDGWIFQPKIVGKSAQLHPVVVILALFAGASFGLMGMIVAVPLAAILRVLWKEFYWDERVAAWKARTGRRSLDSLEAVEKPGL